MKQLDPKVMAQLIAIEELIVERDEAEGPPTYRCPKCLDTGYLSYEIEGRLHAKRCAPCLAREKASANVKDWPPAPPDFLK